MTFHVLRGVPALENGVLRLVLGRNAELDQAVAGAGSQLAASRPRSGRLDLVVVGADEERRLRGDLDGATGRVPLDSVVERVPGRGILRLRVRARRPLLQIAPGVPQRGDRVPRQVVRHPVLVEQGLEHVVAAAARLEVLVVAAEILAEDLEVVVLVAAPRVDDADDAVVDVLVLLRLGFVRRTREGPHGRARIQAVRTVDRAAVGVDAAAAQLERAAPDEVVVFRPRGPGGEQACHGDGD